MLDAWILDEIRRQEQEREIIRDNERPRLEIPCALPEISDENKKSTDKHVIVIQL